MFTIPKLIAEVQKNYTSSLEDINYIKCTVISNNAEKIVAKRGKELCKYGIAIKSSRDCLHLYQGKWVMMEQSTLMTETLINHSQAYGLPQLCVL